MTNLIHKVYRNLSKQYHPDKNPKDKTLHHKLSTFDQLLNNLPFINSKEYQITKSVKNKMISLNESFIKSDVTKQNEILKNLINNITTHDTKNVINTYANYNNKCEAYIIKDDDLKKDDLSFTLKEFEDISTLFLQEIQTDKDEYSKLFNNYKTLYQKCFKAPIEIEASETEKIDDVTTVTKANTINKDQLDLLYKLNVSAYKGTPFKGDEYTFVSARDKNGYYGSAHVNEEQKQLIFTHRGTDSVNLSGPDKKNYDFITAGFKNKDFTEYGECTECDEAISFIEEVLKDGKYKDFSITITGHSLGALLSDVTLYHLNTKGNTNCKSIVFANPGSKTFLEKVASQNGKKLNSDLYKSVSLAINVKGDKLVNHENQLGSEWFIATDQDFGCPSWSPLDIAICQYAGNNHMLKNIRSAVNTFSAEQINTELPNGWELETKAAAAKAAKDAADKAAAAKAAKDAADKAAAAKAAKDAADKAEAARVAKEVADKAEADRVAKDAADKAEAARVAKEAADKAEADRVAKDAADKAAADKAEAQEAIIIIAKDEVLKKNLPINENNIDVLKNVNLNTLTDQYSKESVEDAITTIIASKQDFQQEHLPNLVKSHEIFSDSNTYSAEELDQAESCIMDGEC